MAPDETGFTEAITTEKCLECALQRGAPPCGFDYTLLKYIYSHKRYRALDIHVSDLLSCPRRAWFDKQIEYPATASSRLVVTLGTLQHSLIEEVADENFMSETILDVPEAVGTADTFFPKEGRIVDYKTTRNLSKKMRYLPMKKHVMQVNIYAAMLTAMAKKDPDKFPGVDVEQPVKSTYIQYIDFLGPSMCPRCKAYGVPGPGGSVVCSLCGDVIENGHLGALLVPVPLWDENKTRALIEERAAYLEKNIKENTVPEHPEPDFLCRYCPFLQMCDEGMSEVGQRR